MQTLIAASLWVLSVAIVGAIVYVPFLRHWAARFLRVCLSVVERLTALVVIAFDLLVPINTLNGRAPRDRLFLLVAINLIPVIVWGMASAMGVSHAVLPTSLVATLILGCLNLLFLLGTFFALKETSAIWDSEIRFSKRNFGRRWWRDPMEDFPTAARHPGVVAVVGATLVFQIAVGVQWFDERLAHSVLGVSGSSGVGYVDALLATVSALPVVPLVFAGLGLDGSISFEAGAGFWVGQLITALTSALIVGSLFGFLDQHYALKTLATNLAQSALSPNVQGFLEHRLRLAPSAVKPHLRRAFFQSDDDGVRTRLVRYLLTIKRSFSFSSMFVAHLPAYSPALARDAGEIVAQFLQEHAVRMDEDRLRDIVEATGYHYRTRADYSAENAVIVGRVLLPCLERRPRLALSKDGIKRPVEVCLSVLIEGAGAADLRKRALEILLATDAPAAIAPLLRQIRYFDEDQKVRVLEFAIAVVNKPHVNLGRRAAELKRITAGLWRDKAVGFHGRSLHALSELKKAVEAKAPPQKTDASRELPAAA